LRAVLDPNVIISGLLSRSAPPARLLRACADGAFELIVSAALLDELERALDYPKLRRRIPPDAAAASVGWVRRIAVIARDPGEPHAVRSTDAGDDYLIALAFSQRAPLVSGDRHLLALAGDIPVLSPRDFLRLLDAAG
jgi:putative PIN family toxin of toxin-antitoxin system